MPFSVFKPVSDLAADRLKNPVFGAFILSWILINWAPLLRLIFSHASIETRVLAFGQSIHWWPTAVLPVATSVLFIFGAPWLLLIVEHFNRHVKEQRINQKVEFEKFDLEKNLEIAEMRYKVDTANFKAEDLADLRTSLERARQELQERSSENTSLHSSLEAQRSLSSKLEEYKHELESKIEQLVNQQNHSAEQVISQTNNLNSINAQIQSLKRAISDFQSKHERLQSNNAFAHALNPESPPNLYRNLLVDIIEELEKIDYSNASATRELDELSVVMKQQKSPLEVLLSEGNNKT